MRYKSIMDIILLSLYRNCSRALYLYTVYIYIYIYIYIIYYVIQQYRYVYKIYYLFVQV
jgi:hypothetical protein